MKSTIKDHKFAADEVFGHEQGFDIAIALWEDVNSTIGEIVVEASSWNDTDFEVIPI